MSDLTKDTHEAHASLIEKGDLEAALERTRDETKESGLESALKTVMESALDLFGCSGAGLMFINSDQVLTYAAATDKPGRRLEELQEELGEGPCVDALITDTIVKTVNVQDEDRWPQLAERLSDTPVHAVLGVPVRSVAGAVGSLNVYLQEPHHWNDSEQEALAAFGRLAETILAGSLEAEKQSDLAAELQKALDNRVEIERAVGMIMGRRGVDPVTAFNLLRKRSRDNREKAVEVARQILSGDLDPVSLD